MIFCLIRELCIETHFNRNCHKAWHEYAWGSKEQINMNTAEISFLAVQFKINFFVNENATVISNGIGTSLDVTQSAWQ